MATFKFPVSPDRIRTFKDPTLPKIRIVHALVQVIDLPADIPLDPDPRVPKVKGPITKRITGSLQSNDGRFHLLNRGITSSAKEVEFDNRQNGSLTLNIPDGDVYGIIDGGHTYKAITSAVEAAGDQDPEDSAEDEIALSEQYVHLEILEGVESHLADIAEARNYSIQLKAWTIANHRAKFDWFLEAIGEDYKRYVKVSENDEEPVGVLDLIQVMSAMNPILFPQSSPPLEAYKNSGKCLEYFVEGDLKNKDPNGFRKMAAVARDVIRLHDYVRFNWKKAYNRVDESGRKGRFGKRNETQIRKRNRTALVTYYFLDPAKGPIVGDLPIEKGLSIPLISSFRALLEEKGGKLRWSTDPFKFFDRHGASLVRIVMDASEGKGGIPHHVGRDPQVYNYLFMAANNSYITEKLARLQK